MYIVLLSFWLKPRSVAARPWVWIWLGSNPRGYTILYYTILYYTILYFTILYYTILYYTILYYTILLFTSRFSLRGPGRRRPGAAGDGVLHMLYNIIRYDIILLYDMI